MESLSYFVIPNPGLVKVGGDDRIPFLQRQTTNDLGGLQPGSVIVNALTTPDARIVDVIMVWSGTDHIYLNTLPGRGKSTTEFLNKRIFFRDSVTIENLSDQVQQVEVFGNGLFFGKEFDVSAGNLSVGKLEEWETEIFTGLLFKPRPGTRTGCRFILLPGGEKEAFVKTFKQSGAVELTISEYEVLRILEGVPGPENELTNDFTPLENGLEEVVSLSKGCYTGQEVLARQINFGKVTRHLCGLRFDAPVNKGDRILLEGRSIGVVTSYAVTKQYGPVGLGMVRRPHNEIGTRVEIEGKALKIPTARIVSLPFEA